jgi:hypothetical protein
MQPENIYQSLEDLAEQLGISIRYHDLYDQELHARSGLCTLRGRYVYIMDRSTSLSDRIRLLSQCLCRMDLEGVYVLPAIRELLDGALRTSQAE